MEEPGRLQSMQSQELDMTERLPFLFPQVNPKWSGSSKHLISSRQHSQKAPVWVRLFSEGFPNQGIVFQMIQNGIFHIFHLSVPLPPTAGSFVPEPSVLLPWAALLSPKAPYPGTSISRIPQRSLFLQVYHVEPLSPWYPCLISLWPLSPGLYFSKQTFSPQEEICCQL